MAFVEEEDHLFSCENLDVGRRVVVVVNSVGSGFEDFEDD